jgi:predicted nucleic acid-binding protein
VFDAMIVAVCRETGVDELLTEDVDFRRFRAFRTVSLKEFGRRAGRGSRP